MPTPTIPDGELFFNATTYTGNGGNLTVTNGVAGQSFQPDFVWVKSRSNGAIFHNLFDVIRGAGKRLFSNATNAENTQADSLTAFNSNGFSVGADSGCNDSGGSYVAWQWKAGGAAVTNTAGTISSQVSANTTSGFSVVTYTGTGANATVGHGLGVAPSMVIVKRRSGADSWATFTSMTSDGYLFLNSTSGKATGGAATLFGNGSTTVSPTSTVFSIATDSSVNASSATYVAYCWAPIAGYSAFGSYTGNGSTDGPFIYTGFRPRFILMKASSAVEQWTIWDSSRLGYNPFQAALFPNASSAEDATASGSNSNGGPDFLSNGFKMRSNGGSNNNSGVTYIYYAVAENPFKFANAR